MRAVAHQVDRYLLLAGAAPDVGEGLNAAVVAHHGAVELGEIGRRERAERKAFLAAGFVLEPGIGHGAQLVDVAGNLRSRDDLELSPSFSARRSA